MKNLVALAPVLGAILRPHHYCIPGVVQLVTEICQWEVPKFFLKLTFHTSKTLKHTLTTHINGVTACLWLTYTAQAQAFPCAQARARAVL